MYFFGSYFSLMTEAVGREVQLVRINGDYRGLHGVKTMEQWTVGILEEGRRVSGGSGGVLPVCSLWQKLHP